MMQRTFLGEYSEANHVFYEPNDGGNIKAGVYGAMPCHDRTLSVSSIVMEKSGFTSREWITPDHSFLWKLYFRLIKAFSP